MIFTVGFDNNGVPDDTLSPVINIWEAVAGGAQVATNQAMDLIAVGSGGYTYDLVGADNTKNYYGLAYASTLPAGQKYARCITSVQGNVSDILEDTAPINWADIDFIKAIEGGKWEIDTTANQMIFYEDDNTTEIARFDLFAGVMPASIAVTRRERIIP